MMVMISNGNFKSTDLILKWPNNISYLFEGKQKGSLLLLILIDSKVKRCTEMTQSFKRIKFKCSAAQSGPD